MTADDDVPLDVEPTWTISQLFDWVNGLLRTSLGDEIWIEGEISNLQRSAAGHVYFTLVEARDVPDRTADADVLGAPAAPQRRRRTGPPPTIQVTLFEWYRKNVNAHLMRSGGGVRMSDGVRVRIRGSVEIYGARSQIQIRMTGIDPIFTLGSLAAEREQLLARLRADDLLERNGALELAVLPTRVALVTSVGSAAHADFLHELEGASLGFDLVVIDARVQGQDAERSLIAALGAAVAAGVELVALVRGGGARTDLAAFDLESVARAVAMCPVPVWVGLGHETDRTVVDEVAHRSLKTPTACAAGIAERAGAAREELFALWDAIDGRVERVLGDAARKLDRVGERIVASGGNSLTAAARRLAHHSSGLARLASSRLVAADAHLTNTAASIRRSAPRQLAQHERRLLAVGSTLRAYDPATTLARGFSITRTPDGALVRDHALEVGTRLVTTVATGSVESTVG